MIEVENVKVLLLEDTDFQPCESDSGAAQLTPEADKKAILAEIVIFGDQVIKNRHVL
ncbi:hypothetical protein [Sodalis sp.]|uniref:hypothetical protein n=1 Tax=Sodalis sp. (in: enterobacteria) TaxID=1898979 RepID=UPI002FE9341A